MTHTARAHTDIGATTDPLSRLPPQLRNRLTLPLIGSPMFIVSRPDLVVEQCLSGIVGSLPALNARPPETLDGWLSDVKARLAQAAEAEPARLIAPFAVNLIVHASNDRLGADLETCVRHQVPLIITSLRAPGDVVARVHDYGGLVFHDVTTVRHARKALEGGVDGLILVCAGAGGHAGTLSPFALLREVRAFYDGPLVLAGSISDGASILAAQAMGADLAYMGTRFIATQEANAAPEYKAMIQQSTATDIVYTPYFSGVPANYLKPSIQAAGLEPDNLPEREQAAVFGSGRTKAWRDIWSAGQGVGSITDAPAAADLIARLRAEYEEARERLARLAAHYPAPPGPGA